MKQTNLRFRLQGVPSILTNKCLHNHLLIFGDSSKESITNPRICENTLDLVRFSIDVASQETQWPCSWTPQSSAF
jgi:hypothetical protein